MKSALFVWASLFTLVATAETARVAHVLDGDSLRLSDGRDVRLIGVNTPEHGKDGAPDQPLAREARAFLSRLVGTGDIRLDYDNERHDRYRRLLAHVTLPDGRSAQELLLREGLAFLIAQPPNLTRLDAYRNAETEARRAGRGIWRHAYYKPRPADKLVAGDAGFATVEGRVRRIGRSSHANYLDLGDHFTLVIPHEHWSYFGGDVQRFLNRRVIARGWVTTYQNRLRLRLSHPVMMELAD